MADVTNTPTVHHPRTVYRSGQLFCPSVPGATAFLVSGGRIGWLGTDDDAPPADVVVDLAGAVVTPAFVDAHVHTTDTGIVCSGLDLAGARSAAQVLERVARHADALPGGSVVLGHGWDESGWPRPEPPSPAELDRAAGGRAVYLTQASAHSAVVSPGLLAAVDPSVPGWDESGWLRRDAHHTVREIALGSLGAPQRRAAARLALSRAASLGIAVVHECGGPVTSGEGDFAAVLSLGGDGLPEVVGYWGELGAAERARDLGAAGAAGDLYADGALGSRTAHLRVPYEDGDGSGYGYLRAEQVAAHLVECARAGVQGGFHAIGDRAIGTVLAGFGLAAARLGVERVRAGRHRIEHLELLDRRALSGLVSFGVVASVQPAFDRLWGGPEGMYARRLGTARSLASNPLSELVGVGVPVAFGSDSPVTALDPWGTVRAAMRHHNPVLSVGLRAAFAAHTRGGWRAAGMDGEGVLAVGAPATFAVWSVSGPCVGGLPALVGQEPGEPDPPAPVCRRTVLRGRTIFDADA